MNDSINWTTFFFYLFALVSCGFAVMVVMAASIVRMAFYLTISLGATAGLFFLAGADFVGAMQLMIYVGGTLVLLVFGVMLTAQGPFVSMRTSGGDWMLAALLAGSLLALLVPAAFTVRDWRGGPTDAEIAAGEPVNTLGEAPPHPTATRLGLGLLGIRVDKLDGDQLDRDGHSSDGQPGYQFDDHPLDRRAGMAGYLLPFEIVSIHLLVVLVGAAYLARSKRRRDARPEPR
jgi:NADH-quinone oxidoreductase subunit J